MTEAPTIRPFAAVLDHLRGEIEPSGPVSERRTSDMEGLYQDEAKRQELVRSGDPLVYRVAAAPVPEVAGEVPFSITTIEPGTVGEEFFMTKGHAHTGHEGELYVGLSGRGGLILYDGKQACWLEIEPDSAGYIPPGWAHRTVNIGSEPFRFLAVYPGAAGHDYEFVVERGMGLRVLRDVDVYKLFNESANVSDFDSA